MDKREWMNPVPKVERVLSSEVAVLWAVVERLEALVAIGDALEEVGDLWANSLAFGGQPVGEATPMEVLPVAKPWKCDKNTECVLMKGHGDGCLAASKRYCQCMKPDFAANGVCRKCDYSREVEDF